MSVAKTLSNTYAGNHTCIISVAGDGTANVNSPFSNVAGDKGDGAILLRATGVGGASAILLSESGDSGT